MTGQNYDLAFDKGRVNLAVVYKDIAPDPDFCLGMSVGALQIVKVLRGQGVEAHLWGIKTQDDLGRNVESSKPSHVAVLAPWVESDYFRKLASENPNVNFLCSSHSNPGFLQVDTRGTELLRSYIRLQHVTWNFGVSGNSARFAKWLTRVYGAECTHLPNLYELHGGVPSRTSWNGGPLRIGTFGAIRQLKNFMTAAAAALELAASLRCHLEFWMSQDTTAGSANIQNSITEMFKDLPSAKVMRLGWLSWPRFVQFIGTMHLVLHPSYTETFSVVTADAISKGVPVVASDAVEWLPDHWKASSDDPSAIARVGRHLLQDPHTASEGWEALSKNNEMGVAAWKKWLSGRP